MGASAITLRFSAIQAKLIGHMLLALTFFVAALASPANAARPGDRQVMVLDSGWRFHQGDAARAVSDPAFKDGDWDRVSLPHSWNRVGEYRTERTDRTNAYQGASWYRLRFTAPSRPAGGRSFLQFDGVGSVADVWLNGRRIGRHEGAFSRFRFDVTDFVQPGQPAVVVVRADNSKPAPGSPTGHVIPLSGDFFIYGGIYRPVSLVTTGPVHVDLLDHAGPGVYATTISATPAKAAIEVRTRLRNEAASDGPVEVVASLLDAGGRRIATTSMNRTVSGSDEVRQQLDVDKPHLWNGRADPYLYRVEVELRWGKTVLDRVTEPFGIRTVRFDPDRGFFLNGKSLPLHGVSRHQDRLGKGWALTTQDHEEDMALIEEIGANTIRFAHYQHAPDWFRLADERGMVVWAEVPFVNQTTFGPGAPSPALIANARQQMLELIRQNQNHPSVVTWSVGNEVDIKSSGEGRRGNSRGLLRELAALAKQTDPSRPTTFADCCERVPGKKGGGSEMLAGTTDLIGYNRYFGWYNGKPDDLGPELDRLHRLHSTLPMSVSEYGAGGALTQHTDTPHTGPFDPHGRPQPEEYQSWLLERQWLEIKARPYLWASWVWNMFDFATNTRAEGDAVDINTKGLMTFDRKTRKDAFYFFKANWSATPVLYITARRFVERPDPVTDVKIYSNADSVRLVVNGRDLGSRSCPDRICLWPGVTLAAGANDVVAQARFGTTTLSDRVAWRAPAAADGDDVFRQRSQY